MRLYRPYIPWSVRERVIDRQMAEAGMPNLCLWILESNSAEERVRCKLQEFFRGERVELHHRPALCNRKTVYGGYVRNPQVSKNFVAYAYEPDANDPDYLVYLLAGAGEEHDVETRVRGQHGQHSDLALARKRRRKERKAKQRKRSWPKRKLRWTSRWTA